LTRPLQMVRCASDFHGAPPRLVAGAMISILQFTGQKRCTMQHPAALSGKGRTHCRSRPDNPRALGIRVRRSAHLEHARCSCMCGSAQQRRQAGHAPSSVASLAIRFGALRRASERALRAAVRHQVSAALATRELAQLWRARRDLSERSLYCCFARADDAFTSTPAPARYVRPGVS
jgi:hypothetical protein